MKNFAYLLFAFLLTLAPVLQAKDVAAAGVYFDPASFDYKTLLPDPPAVGSPEAKKEIELILEKQKSRTEDDKKRIKLAEHPSMALFQDTLGSWFDLKKLSATATLLKNVDADAHPVVEAAKAHWNRPRPPLQDSRVQASLDLPKNTSYPSGHASFGMLNALILAELVPDLKEQIMARGMQIGDDRVIAGIHFPSDVEAGRTLGKALFAKFMVNPAFQADMTKARAEIMAARAKP